MVDKEWEAAWESSDDDIPIIDMVNLGPKCEQWLAEINIHCKSELEAVGIIEAYLQIKERFDGINVNLLYAMYGAIHGIGFNMIGPGQRQRLKAQLAEALTSREDTSELT